MASINWERLSAGSHPGKGLSVPQLQEDSSANNLTKQGDDSPIEAPKRSVVLLASSF